MKLSIASYKLGNAASIAWNIGKFGSFLDSCESFLCSMNGCQTRRPRVRVKRAGQKSRERPSPISELQHNQIWELPEESPLGKAAELHHVQGSGSVCIFLPIEVEQLLTGSSVQVMISSLIRL